MRVCSPIRVYFGNGVGFSESFDEAFIIDAVRIRQRAINIEDCQLQVSSIFPSFSLSRRTVKLTGRGDYIQPSFQSKGQTEMSVLLQARAVGNVFGKGSKHGLVIFTSRSGEQHAL